MSKKIKDEQKKFLGETLNQYDKALNEGINQLDKKNREQNHKISSLVNSFDNEYLEKDVEGNMTTLENSKDGMVIINEIQGSTEVNYCKDGEKELILNGDIDTQGESFVTITESVDGGLVDVSLEGNTEINLSKTKDPVLVTREFDDINCNVGKLQYTIDDVTTVNDEPGKVDIDRIVGDTMVNHAVNGSEELILNAHINESGDNSIKLNGVTSDGGKVDVALEGNTLVNVSKTKDSTAITKAYTVENSGNHVALQGDVDGSCRPVITGNTLVNLLDLDFKDKEATSNNPAYVNSANNEIGWDWSIGQRYNNWIQINNKLNMVQLNKTYTLIANIKQNNPMLDGKLTNKEIWGNLWILGCNIIQIPIPLGTTGIHKWIFTTTEGTNQQYNMIGWTNNSKDAHSDGDGILINGGKLVIGDIMLLEGDYTNKAIPDYFEGLQSSFEDNLVTQEMVDNGEEVADNLGKYRVDYKSTQEDGTVGSTKTLYLNSPLLEGDTIEEKDGCIYHVHRYGKVVFDGSDDENWLNHSATETLISFVLVKVGGVQSINTAICDKLKKKSEWYSEEEGIWVDQNCIITISKSKSNNIKAFKTYLSNNPISVVYELETPTYELIEQSNLVIPSYASGHLDFNTAVPIEKVDFLPFSEELTYLYANTQYTLQFNSDKAITADITLGGTKLLAQSIVKGLNRISITTPSELVDNKLVINGVGANISEVVVTDTNREFGYFEGMKSVGECEGSIIEIVSRNKNIFDGKWQNGTYYSFGTGTYTITLKDKDLSKLKTGMSFGTCSMDGGGINWMVNGTSVYQRKRTITDKKLIFRPSTKEGLELWQEIFDIQIEEGSTATDYIPQQSNAQTLTHEPLRAVGDVRDKYILIDGKWYIERHFDEKVLDGTGNFILDTTTTLGNYFVVVTDSLPTINDGNLYVKCDKLPAYYGSIYTKPTRGIYYVQKLKFKLLKSELPSLDIDNFKTWLSNNPIRIVYQLASPTYEPIDYNPLEVYSDVTHISTNSVIPTNLTVKNHGYNMVALKENTQYTLYVNKDTTNALTYRLGDYVEINSPSKFTFTTPETLTDKTLRIDSKGTKVNDLMLIEGISTNDPIGYFDGLKSSYECEQVVDENDEHYGKYRVNVKVTGKNKFDGQWQKAERAYGVYYYGKGTYTISIQEKDLSLLDNKCLLGYANLDGSNVNWMYLNGEVIERNKTLTNGKLVFRMPTKEGFELLKRAFDIQIEEGNTATEYEPYFESIQTVYLNSPLLKGDEIVWKDNKIQHYHKMKTIVLDGSDDENISIETTLIKDNTIGFKYFADDLQSAGYCDNFIYEFSFDDKEHYVTNPGWACFLVSKSKLQIQDSAGFRQYLQANPVTVVYQLVEPYYEEISDYPLKLNVIANSSLSTESTIQVTNISFNIYEETLPYLYPNTKYYITFNADVDRNNIIINLGGNHVVFDCKVGFNKVEITTPSDTTNLLTFSGTGVNIDHVKVTQQDIDEYFEGMKSVGECEELEITSANSDNTLLNTQTLTHEPLRAVGEVKDRYVLIDNKWYIERRCGEIALESLQWEYNSTITNSGNTFAYTGGIDNILVQSQVTKNYFLCNIVETTKVHNHEVDKEQITQFIHSSGIALRISRDKLQDNSVDSLNEYLSNNNAKLVYQLATPVYEEIDYNPFEVYPDVTHITTNSLIPTNVVVKNHGYNCILKPSTKYTVALNKLNGTISAKLGGSAKVDSTNNVFTITTPSTLNDNVLRLSGSGRVKDIIILEGDKTVNTPSYFEGIESVFEQEYDTEKGKYRVTARVVGNSKESSIIFYVDEPLRGVGTAKDRVFIKDNKVVVERNCASVTFDGSDNENWVVEGLVNKTLSCGYLYAKVKLNLCSQLLYCDTLPVTEVYNKDVEGIDIHSNLALHMRVHVSRLTTQDVVGFKQWLQQNPTTIIYELAEPVYEEVDCDLSKLILENYENSSLIFESNIPVSANIRYSGEVPVVTQAKSLSSQVDNTTLDINENIIPYMCDIDYRIVELQLMNGDTQGEGIELLGIGDIEILGNENVLFNNREDKKYNYSYDMLKRDILSQRYSKEEYQYRLDRYLLANKISDEEYKELEGLLNNGE